MTINIYQRFWSFAPLNLAQNFTQMFMPIKELIDTLRVVTFAYFYYKRRKKYPNSDEYEILLTQTS